MNTRLLSLIFVSLWSTLAFGEVDAQADSVESMTVTAERLKERERASRTSQSIAIRPEESSRFDTTALLKEESALSFAETGRISPSGFTVPRIRGQDSRLTDVYLDDIQLQNPYNGLPLIEDLDLRAFGLLELHQGVSPIDVPNLNPVGTLRYRLKPADKSGLDLGTNFGAPYGQAIWALGLQKGEDQELRIYAREHQTSGHYPYYSDEGTPYNARDDQRKIRTNNDQRSQQLLPVYRRKIGDYSIQALGWLYASEGGLPTSSMVLPSDARESTHGHLGDLSLRRDWADIPLLGDSEATFHVGHTEDKRETTDHDKRVLISSTAADMKVDSLREGLTFKSRREDVRTLLNYEGSESRIEQAYDGTLGTALKRQNHLALAGLAWTPFDSLLIEGKASNQWQHDHVDRRSGVILQGESNPPERTRQSPMQGVSVAFGDFANGLYAQYASAQRLPSLLEEFGDGSALRPNDLLKAEKLHHQEIGGFFSHAGIEFGGAWYHDRTDDKIVFVPVLANASKALNIAKTTIDGYDLSAHYSIARAVLAAKTSMLTPLDTSLKTHHQIPGIAKQVVVLDWQQGWLSGLRSHLTARYRSDIYRDVANSVKLPGAWIYDMNLDAAWRRWQLGLALRNLLNTTAVDLDSGSSHGRTALSDFAGAPLPGRQWVVSLVYHFGE